MVVVFGRVFGQKPPTPIPQPPNNNNTYCPPRPADRCWQRSTAVMPFAACP